MAKKQSKSAVEKAFASLMGGKKLTEADRSLLRQVGESVIDDFMKAVGISEPERLTDENGWRHLTLESAKGIAGLIENDGELFLHVEAIVMQLPSDRDLIHALMRETLELNCKLPGASSLGIRGANLVASATENIRSIREPADYGSLIHSVMALANAIDDELQKKYSGTTRVRKKQAS